MRALDAAIADKMVGSIECSAEQYASRMTSWLLFCRFVRKSPLPADLLTVLRFVSTFANGRSAATYVTALRFLHHRFLQPTSAWDGGALAALLRGSKKLTPPPQRAEAISFEFAEAMATIALARREHDEHLLIVWSFNFGFRVQSEALPLCFDSVEVGGHSSVDLVQVQATGATVLRVMLRRRKNAPNGAILSRPCICARSQMMCPVHAFKRWIRAKNLSSRSSRHGRLFPGLSASSFQRRVMTLARLAKFPKADRLRLHGFRRGMAQDILRRGGSLAEILAAGGWRSAAFLAYLDKNEIEQEVMLDFLCDDDVDAAEAAREAIPPELRALVVPPPGGTLDTFVEDMRFELAEALGDHAPGHRSPLASPRVPQVPALPPPQGPGSEDDSPRSAGELREQPLPALPSARGAPAQAAALAVRSWREEHEVLRPPPPEPPKKKRRAKPTKSNLLNPTMLTFLR